MKDTAPERLAKAIVSLQNRIHSFCKKHNESDFRMGMCLAHPKRAFLKPPTKEIQEKLEQIGKDHFTPLGVHGFYFQYFTPPISPIMERLDINTPVCVDDYQLIFELPTFDAKWQMETAVRSLLYCPGNDAELGCWQEWFNPQLEAIRLTPLLFQQLKEHRIIGGIRLCLLQPPHPIFEAFVHDHVLNDDHLGINDKERKLCAEGKTDWKLLYPEIKGLLNSTHQTLHNFYKVARAKAVQSRNPKIKSLLWAFVDYVEERLIKTSELPENLKDQLLDDLKGVNNKRQEKKYQAKRPAICLSDIECAKALYFFIRKFLSSPKKNQISGEITLYIWICQHAAFSNLNVGVEDVLAISVTDINFQALTINIAGKEADITCGLRDLIAAWLGNDERQNKRKLFPTLTIDNLEKNLIKFSEGFFERDGRLLPRDFLGKAHVIAGARIPIELRKQFDFQETLTESSPYKIDTRKIKKHILEAFNKNRV